MSREYNGNEMNNDDEQKGNVWNRFTKFVRDNKKTIIKNYLIFFCVLFGVLLIDMLTKATLFEWGDAEHTQGLWNAKHEGEKNFVIFGIRSVENKTTTIMKTAPKWLIQTLSFIVLIFLLSIPLFTLKKPVIILVAIIAAGDLGNAIDRIKFGMVKDIIFVPFWERWTKQEGTFNVADCYIVLGVIALILYYVINFFVEANKKMKDKAVKPLSHSDDDKNDSDNIPQNNVPKFP